MTMTSDFDAAVERHRRELHVHCYRMLGLLRGGRGRDPGDVPARVARARDAQPSDAGRRAWLYKIATNVCLDALRRTKRQVPTDRPRCRGCTPYPDRLLDEVAPSEEEPDAVVVARETIELTFITLIQLLPARQRAVVILRDVLDWSAAETAALLDMSVASANSALQRARATLREQLPERTERARPSSARTSSGCWRASSPPTRRATPRPPRR